MKVLVADKLPDSGRHALEELGLRVTYLPDATAEALPELVADHDVLVVRSTRVTRETLDAAASLQLVVRAGAGTNTIDVAHASALGVFVANCPGKNAVAVAELALGLLLALDRRIPQAAADLKLGTWNKKEYGKAGGLFGRTLGVIGTGTIGRELITRARALGMRVAAWSRSLTDERAVELGVARAPTIESLASNCDAMSIHLAYSDETKGLIGRTVFEALPKGALVVNTSRGGIVDEKALLEAIEQRQLRYAADVFDGEPAGGHEETNHPVATDPRVVATPHIGASTQQAQEAVAEEAVRIVAQFIASGHVPNAVNQCERSPAAWQLTVRHLDRVGVLAAVLAMVREAEINVEEVENVIFDGAVAACARIRLDSEPPSDLVDALGRIEHVLDARLMAL